MELTHPYVDLRGFENMLVDFYDYPEKMHEILELFTRGYEAKLDFLEQNHLLTPNTGNCYVGSGGLGLTNDLNPGVAVPNSAMDIWGFHESQETGEVSPEMFKEFILPYQLRLAKRFGLNYYGCCEGLDRRFECVRQDPASAPCFGVTVGKYPADERDAGRRLRVLSQGQSDRYCRAADR